MDSSYLNNQNLNSLFKNIENKDVRDALTTVDDALRTGKSRTGRSYTVITSHHKLTKQLKLIKNHLDVKNDTALNRDWEVFLNDHNDLANLFNQSLPHTSLNNNNQSVEIQPVKADLEKVISSFKETGQNPELYGNKTANLMRLASNISNGNIPEFLGLSDESIRTFLQNNGINFTQIFDEARQLDKDNGQELCNESCKLLEKLQDDIKKLFSDDSFDTKEIQAFLEMIKDKQPARVMVRSTGREDSIENANAGGNLSKVDIAPEVNEIRTAIGEVVASYFDKKSLVQSLSSGGETYKEPFTPVLLQLMVGEDPSQVNSKQTPSHSSGVMFTREPEGEYDPLVQIQASYGHGEGVVTSQVMCDTYYIHEDLKGQTQRHLVIRDKPARLVPTGKGGGVQSVMNPNAIRSKDCLTSSALDKLQSIGKEIQDLYACPMDIEWVYDQKKDTVYLVQARPLVKKSSTQAQPSYLDIGKVENKTKGSLIVAAGGSLKTINKESEIIIAKTLSEALNQYVRMDDSQRKQVKSIITESWAAATSHEATTFRGEQIPVLFMQDSAKEIRESFSQGKKLLFDSQNELVAAVDHEFDEESAKITGWKTYPIAKELSVFTVEFNSLQEVEDSLRELTQNYNENLKETPNSELIDALSDLSEPVKALEALSVLSERLLKYTEKNHDKLNMNEVRDLFTNYILAGKELRNAIHDFQNAKTEEQKETLQTAALYSKRWIETLIHQKKGKISHGLSFHTLAEETKTGGKVNALWTDQTPPQKTNSLVSTSEAKALLTQYLSLEKIFYSPQDAKKFENFVAAVANSRNKTNLSYLNQLIYQTQKEGVTVPFFNGEFAKITNQPPEKVLAQLGKAYSRVINETEPLKKLYNTLDIWESKIATWGDQGQFEQNWSDFQKEIIPLMQDKNLIEMLGNEELSDISKNKVQLLITRLVDCYDQSIKSMKSGVPYDVNLKIDRFKKMLVPYHEMMKLYMSSIDQVRFDELCHSADANQSQPGILNGIEKKFKEVLEKDDVNQLMPSGDVNIDSCVFTSKTSISRQLIEKHATLEDFFSVFHQNTLAATQELTRTEHHFPEALTLPMKLLENHGASMISVDPYKPPQIEVKFNKTMHNHSAVFSVKHDFSTKVTDIELHYFGESKQHESRGQAILSHILIYSALNQLPCPSVSYQHEESTISWRFDEQMTEETCNTLGNGLSKFDGIMNTPAGSAHQFNPTSDQAIGLLQQGPDWFERLTQAFSPQTTLSSTSSDLEEHSFSSQIASGNILLNIFNKFINCENKNIGVENEFKKLLFNNPKLIKTIHNPSFEIVQYLTNELPEDKKELVWELIPNFNLYRSSRGYSVQEFEAEEFIKSVKLLIDKGVNCNYTTTSGNTPFMILTNSFKTIKYELPIKTGFSKKIKKHHIEESFKALEDILIKTSNEYLVRKSRLNLFYRGETRRNGVSDFDGRATTPSTFSLSDRDAFNLLKSVYEKNNIPFKISGKDFLSTFDTELPIDTGNFSDTFLQNKLDYDLLEEIFETDVFEDTFYESFLDYCFSKNPSNKKDIVYQEIFSKENIDRTFKMVEIAAKKIENASDEEGRNIYLLMVLNSIDLASINQKDYIEVVKRIIKTFNVDTSKTYQSSACDEKIIEAIKSATGLSIRRVK